MCVCLCVSFPLTHTHTHTDSDPGLNLLSYSDVYRFNSTDTATFPIDSNHSTLWMDSRVLGSHTTSPTADRLALERHQAQQKYTPATKGQVSMDDWIKSSDLSLTQPFVVHVPLHTFFFLFLSLFISFSSYRLYVQVQSITTLMDVLEGSKEQLHNRRFQMLSTLADS